MKTIGVIASFVVVAFSLVMFVASDDISRNAATEEARQNVETAQIEHNNEVMAQWKAEQYISSLGCITLDCAIDKSMKR